jgi:Xaa-Pro aminopeptidase
MSNIALQFEALKVALKQDSSGYVLTIKIHPDEIPEELFRDFVGARYMVAMARINDDEEAVPVRNRVQKAAILCKDRLFQDYVNFLYGLPKTEKAAIDFVYDICSIKSRTELNGNKDAQEQFDRMVNEFEEWRDKDVPF